MGAQSIRVLKFGSSVLSSRSDLSRALHEIYRELREGRRVVAVVSALGGTTNRLLASARRVDPRARAAPLAMLVSTGEMQAAALLALALERAGISCVLLDPAQIGLVTRGPLLEAQPVSLDASVVRNALREKSVAVIPGFVGRDARGRTSLLGRGGSDLSALFLAAQLGASCRLVKDVAGIFDRDPAQSAESAQRYATLAWSDALAIGGRVVQEKALRFALEHRLEFEVGAFASTESTIVGSGPSRLAVSRSRSRRLRVVLLGLGTVGLGVYRELARFGDRFEIELILVRRLGQGRPKGVPPHLITTDVERVNACACDVMVEVLGGAQPAGTCIAAALRRGADVVSANKGLVVERGEEFRALSVQSGARFLHSASVGGALPVLEIIRHIAREQRIVAIEGILNSTTNVVLDLLARGANFEEALAHAKRQGFCEADPAQDLDGTDAAHKLALVAREAFGQEIPAHWIAREGIDKLSQAQVRSAFLSGNFVRLVASCRRVGAGVELQLIPMLLDDKHPLAKTRREQNALVIRTEDGSTILLNGKGAGRWPTAQSVLGDVLELSRLREGHGNELPLTLERAAAC